MKEIGEIYLGRMNNGAHYLYVSDILARAEADTNVKSKAAAQVAALRTCAAREDADLKLSRKSLLTDDIAEADAKRDSLYSGYKKAVQGFLNLPVEAMAQAAKVLNQHLSLVMRDLRVHVVDEGGVIRLALH